MSYLSTLVVTKDAYLTLHYRLSDMDGTDIISTFNDSPSTLQMGKGQLAPGLETALLGLQEGSHIKQELTAENAFGPRNPALIQRVSLATLQKNSAFGEHYAVGDLVDFAAPSGGKFAGILKAIDDEGALFDFNHPLAGRSLVLEAKIIGIL